jgi:hypothetical protein
MHGWQYNNCHPSTHFEKVPEGVLDADPPDPIAVTTA